MKKTPAHLSKEASNWFADILTEYQVEDPAGLLLLQTAMEAFDAMREAQSAIAEDGRSFRDRFDQIKAHPLLAAERDARSQMIQSLKALNLDLEPLRDAPGRPGGS